MQFDKIIVVDDDPLIRRMLVGHLQKRNIPVAGVANCQQAQDLFQQETPDLMVIDLLLPDGDGLSLMRSIKSASPSTHVIIMTGFGTIESAVEAMKEGAANYLLKPFTLPQFDVALQQLLEKKVLQVENNYLREQLDTSSSGKEMLFQSPEMERVHQLIQKVAPTNATILVEGESGTGKELVSRAIYQNSLRKDKPYIKVNCAAVPENLLESEFFGHEKGAFTGATNRREGRFELAHGGTILLDEITEISLGLQAKLLRVLQEREFERVGGNRTLSVDVRVIATTNRDLSKAVEAGEFRSDLYFRLNVVPIHLPPLRQRAGEVEFLITTMVERFAKIHGKPKPKVSAKALKQLSAYSWPGNVRELQNYAERAVILADAGRELQWEDFIASPAPTITGSESKTSSELPMQTIADMERELIMKALEQTQGRRNEAAELLGINVRTLRNKLNQYGQTVEEEQD